MTQEQQPDTAPFSPADLADMIAAFDSSAEKLQASHDALKTRVDELTGELARKNEELSSSFAEVNALKNYLANILESITDGVITIGVDRQMVAHNQAALNMIPPLRGSAEETHLMQMLPEDARVLGELLEQGLCEENPCTSVEIAIGGKHIPRRILSVSVSPIRNQAGELIGAVETFRDITDVKRLEGELERKERLAALGEMAAGVAHEIRNPLGGIELYASILKKHFEDDTKPHGICNRIIEASTSLNRIVEDMLTFTRSSELVRQAVPLEHVCHMALDLAAAALEEKSIVVETAFGTEGERVSLAADPLSRAVLNVILNAVQVMEPGGFLRIATRFTPEHAGNPRRVILTIADTGPGIDPEVAEKIFNPFFTTRNDGTGLGLAIVHKIAQDHGGEVRVEANQPHGAVFLFELPV